MKKVLIVFACIVLILIISNPSPADFKNFVSHDIIVNPSNDIEIRYSRVANVFIYSLYEYKIYQTTEFYEDRRHQTKTELIERGEYYGVLKNFF